MKSSNFDVLNAANDGAISPFVAADYLSSLQLINAKQLMTLLPVSRMTIWRLEKQALLPKHISIGGRNYWRLSEVVESLGKLSEAKLLNEESA